MDAWERLFDPDELRPMLLLSSIYITCFEILKNLIIEKPKDFFTFGYDSNGFIVDESYNTEVLARNRSEQYASLEWFLDFGAITHEDIETYTRIKNCRNKLAHELTRLLDDGMPEGFNKNFEDILYLINKIETWWIMEIEIPINAELDGKDIKAEDVISMTQIVVKTMVEVALGPDEEAYKYLEEFRKQAKKRT